MSKKRSRCVNNGPRASGLDGRTSTLNCLSNQEFSLAALRRIKRERALLRESTAGAVGASERVRERASEILYPDGRTRREPAPAPRTGILFVENQA